MSLAIIILKQDIKIACLLSRFIITNTILNLFLSLGIDLKSIIIYYHKCSDIKKDYNSLKVRSLRISARRQAWQLRMYRLTSYIMLG